MTRLEKPSSAEQDPAGPSKIWRQTFPTIDGLSSGRHLPGDDDSNDSIRREVEVIMGLNENGWSASGTYEYRFQGLGMPKQPPALGRGDMIVWITVKWKGQPSIEGRCPNPSFVTQQRGGQ